jgi:hypothetical protein
VTFSVPLTKEKIYALQFPEQADANGGKLDFDTIFYTVNRLRPEK